MPVKLRRHFSGIRPRHAREQPRRHRLLPPRRLHARTRQQLEELASVNSKTARGAERNIRTLFLRHEAARAQAGTAQFSAFPGRAQNPATISQHRRGIEQQLNPLFGTRTQASSVSRSANPRQGDARCRNTLSFFPSIHLSCWRQSQHNRTNAKHCDILRQAIHRKRTGCPI